MNIDLIQLLYYAGFTLLGWWLRHQGLLKTPATPPLLPSPLPADQKSLIEFLKTLLDRLVQPTPSNGTEGTSPATVFHVPVEVAATTRNPR